MKKFNDNNLHFMIGLALRTGVFLSMIFMIIGGIGYLLQYGHGLSHFSTFRPEKPSFIAICRGIFSLQPESVVYLGIVLLITTPIMRVLLSAFSFAMEKDRLYTVITSLVLLIIIFSIVTEHAA